MKRLLPTILAGLFTLSITAQVWNSDTKMSHWLHAKYSQEMQEVKKKEYITRLSQVNLLSLERGKEQGARSKSRENG